MKRKKLPSPEIRVELDLGIEKLLGLLVGALEGGSDYWMEVGALDPDAVTPEDVKTPEGKAVLQRMEMGGFTRRDTFYMVLALGGRVYVRDRDDGEVYTLDRAALRRGAGVMVRDYPQHFGAFLAEQDDATTADVYLQCCLLGEVVYG